MGFGGGHADRVIIEKLAFFQFFSIGTLKKKPAQSP
jgi:hypothetical protein